MTRDAMSQLYKITLSTTHNGWIVVHYILFSMPTPVDTDRPMKEVS